ncbi:YbaK/EbsC family protein [Bacillus smithii]|uniref:YbaK/EbsC family protein n=1 Tax=Bacillus smithii TaxID=1479 RepID=UPI003D1F0CF6
MSLESVRAHLKKWNRDQDIMVFDTSSATVEQAAQTIGVEPARIAKTLCFRSKGDSALLVVTAGDAKIDNKKFRHTFGFKAGMLSAEEVLEQTGHAVGGVCPFGLANDLDIFLDLSLKRFKTVFPACGSINSAIEVSPEDLWNYSGAKDWIDVCKDWQESDTKGKTSDSGEETRTSESSRFFQR